LCHSIIIHERWFVIIVIDDVGDKGVAIHGWWFTIIGIRVSDVDVTIWSRGHDAVCVSWIVCIINGCVSMRGGGCMSRINTSSVGGDTYDRGVVIHRWWLIIVRGRIIFIDV
jgi:hypothetical protein